MELCTLGKLAVRQVVKMYVLMMNGEIPLLFPQYKKYSGKMSYLALLNPYENLLLLVNLDCPVKEAKHILYSYKNGLLTKENLYHTGVPVNIVEGNFRSFKETDRYINDMERMGENGFYYRGHRKREQRIC